MSKYRLLIAAQDYASGQAFLSLKDTAALEDLFEVFWLLAAPASSLFSPGDKTFHVDLYNKTELNDLLAMALPDVVLSGISGEGIGLDEIVIAHFKDKVPTFSYQDFWGYVNLNAGCHADTVLVMDDLAKQLTKPHAPNASLINVGILKEGLLRQQLENISLMPKESHQWVFIGQPLWSIAGYQDSILDVIRVARDLNKEIYYLPHPAELQSGRIRDIAGIHILEEPLTQNEKLKTLLGAEKVISCFSTMLHDVLIMKNIIGIQQPALGAIFLHDDIIDYYQKHSGNLSYFPLNDRGVTEIRSLSALRSFNTISPLSSSIDPANIGNPVNNVLAALANAVLYHD